MSLLPLGLLAPVTSLGRSAGSAAVAVGTGFAGLLKSAMQQAGAAAENTQGNAGSQSTGSATPVDGGPSAAAIAELRKQTDDQIGAFNQQLMQLLASSGIDISSGLHLQLDDFGQLRVAGDHPQKHTIETILGSHPELEDQFRDLAARSDAIHQFDENKSGLLPGATSGRFDLFVSASGPKGSHVTVAA